MTTTAAVGAVLITLFRAERRSVGQSGIFVSFTKQNNLKFTAQQAPAYVTAASANSCFGMFILMQSLCTNLGQSMQSMATMFNYPLEGLLVF